MVHRDLKIISLEEYWFVALNLVVLGINDLSHPLIATIITDYILWWINMCINWLGKEMPRKLAKHYFFVFVRIFLKEISIGIIRLSKEECPSHVCIIQSFEGLSWRRKQRRGEGWDCFSLFAGSSVLEPQVLMPLDSEWIISLAFLVL